MLTNELIFIIHAVIISIAVIVASRIGKEALVALLCIQAVLSNLFVTKQIILFGLCATCADVFSVGSSLSLNLLQEYFGKDITKKAIWISFFILIFYLIMTQIHLVYAPNIFDFTQSHYANLLQFAPRIVLASLVAYLACQYLDAILYGYFKEKFKNFILRNYSSLIISQFVDTLLFSFLGLYGIVEGFWQIFLVSYGIKVLTIILAAPLVAFCRRLINAF